MAGEVEALIAELAGEAVPALKKIAAAKGRLQGSFYFACSSAASVAGVVVTLAARDPKGQKAASAGKKLRKAIPGARFARGTVTSDGKKLTLTLYTGNATPAHIKKSIKGALEDKALAALKRLLRTARIATPSGAIEAPEEPAESAEDGLTEEERAELETLLAQQAPLLAQSEALLSSFLSVHEEAAERAEIVSGLSEEIAAMEAAGLHSHEALAEKRRQLAEALSVGDLPDSAVLPQELRHLLTLSTERTGEAIAVFQAAAWERVCGEYAATSAAVREQLAVLREALLSDGDPELALIAVGGLPGLLAPHHDRLDGALVEDGIARSAESLRAVRGAAAGLVDRLGSAPVGAVEDNPLGVAVGLHTRLRPALSRLADAAASLEGGRG